MRYILRQAAWTSLSVLFLYLIALGGSFGVGVTVPNDAGLNTWAAYSTLFLTAPKYVFLGRYALDTPAPKVLIVGASNAGVGFQRDLLQSLVGCAQVSNLAVGNANISEVRQVVDLVHEVQDDRARQADTFVLGVWYGMFAGTTTRWPGGDRHRGDTDIDIERYRYGFYRRTEAGPVPVLPPAWLHAGSILIRPYLVLEMLARNATAQLRQAVSARTPAITDADRDAAVMSDHEKQLALTDWHHDKMGGAPEISQRQVTILQTTIERLLDAGEKVVLVDLPIPAWHRDASPYEPSYAREVETGVFDHFAGRTGFVGLKLADLAGDRDYSDEVHPKPYLARQWADRLAGVLNPLVCTERTASLGH